MSANEESSAVQAEAAPEKVAPSATEETKEAADANGAEEEEESVPIPELLEDAKRNFALRKWNEAADGYGQALDALREEYPDDTPLLAPLHHRYGHAMLEYAIATSGALGGGGGGKDAPLPSRSGNASTVAAARQEANGVAGSSKDVAGSSASAKTAQDPRFVFGGDAEDSDDEDDAPQQGGEDDEDDLGDAFSVLEMARVRYEKLLEDGESLTTLDGETWDALMIKSQLAEVLNDLADVGLESENFQQASSDYQSALDLLEPLLQPHSRRLADAYLRLGLALEFHPDAGMQASAEKYVKAACMVMRKRLEALESRQATLQRDRDGEQTGLAEAETAAVEVRREKVAAESAARLQEEGVLAASASANGKGKAEGSTTLEKDDVARMDWQAVKKETHDVKEMLQELEMKLEEYTSAQPGAGPAAGGSAAGGSAGTIAGDTRAALQQAINEALLGGSTNAIAGGSGSGTTTAFGARATDPNAPINDLSAMVKKKRKAPAETAAAAAAAAAPTETNGKRKADGEEAIVAAAASANDAVSTSKRARVEEYEE